MTVQSSDETVARESAATLDGRPVTRLSIALGIAERLLLVAVGAVGGLIVGGVIALFVGWIEFRC